MALTECPICMEECREDTIITSCKHTFHEKCLHEWLKTKDTCPMCRCKQKKNASEEKQEQPEIFQGVIQRNDRARQFIQDTHEIYRGVDHVEFGQRAVHHERSSICQRAVQQNGYALRYVKPYDGIELSYVD